MRKKEQQKREKRGFHLIKSSQGLGIVKLVRKSGFLAAGNQRGWVVKEQTGEEEIQ